jgi:hypothetical protein
VRTIIEYNLIIFPISSESNKKKLRAIQYKALRIAFKEPIKTKNEELIKLAKTTTLDKRIEIINKKYFENCIIHNNELVKDIIKRYKNWYTCNKECKYKKIVSGYRKEIDGDFD